ncbi:hypothetical protein SAMN02787142_8298 [Burkholderia sp. WP9]|nr:hypothetical protein SAMN02787142_8298 [Burkholderia sp. WP9]
MAAARRRPTDQGDRLPAPRGILGWVDIGNDVRNCSAPLIQLVGRRRTWLPSIKGRGYQPRPPVAGLCGNLGSIHLCAWIVGR